MCAATGVTSPVLHPLVPPRISPPRRISIDNFALLSDAPDSVADREFFIIAGQTDLSTSTIQINVNCILRFDRSARFQIAQFSVRNCSVGFYDLHLLGGISCDYGSCVISHCTFEYPGGPPGAETHLFASNQSKIQIENSRFLPHKYYGIAVEGGTHLSMKQCTVSGCEMLALGASDSSKVVCTECTFSQSKDALVSVRECTQVTFFGCVFERAGDNGLCADLTRDIRLTNCRFEKCKMGAVRALHCPNVVIEHSAMTESDDSSCIFNNSRATLDNVTIRKATGNGVWISRKSAVTVVGCTIEETLYPLVGIFDQSSARISRSTLAKCAMNGIVVRLHSQLIMEATEIRDCDEFGLVSSACETIQLKACRINRCGRGFVSALDHAFVRVEACEFADTKTPALVAYTGGHLAVSQTQVKGTAAELAFVHHGGSADLTSVTFTEAIDQPIEQLFRIETMRSVQIRKCSVNGVGPIDIIRNPDAPSAVSGVAAVKPKCANCGNLADCISVCCGHAVYCSACWDALQPKPDKCALCFLPIEKLTKLVNCGDDDLCAICVNNPVDSAVGGCGHALCMVCARSWFDDHTECPFCRTATGTVREFVSYA
jgi:hypothetical protein